MANQKIQHIVTIPNGGLDIKKGGTDRASEHCNTKQVAIEKIWEISQNQGSELYISGLDGRIQQKDSHGNDPSPPKDNNLMNRFSMMKSRLFISKRLFNSPYFWQE